MFLKVSKEDRKKIDKELALSGVFSNLDKKDKTVEKTENFHETRNLFTPKILSEMKTNITFITNSSNSQIQQYCAWDRCELDNECPIPNGIYVPISRRKASYMEITVYETNGKASTTKTMLENHQVNKYICSFKNCNFVANPYTKLCDQHICKIEGCKSICVKNRLCKDHTEIDLLSNDLKHLKIKDETKTISKLFINNEYNCECVKVCSFECMLAYKKSQGITIANKCTAIISSLYKDIFGFYPYPNTVHQIKDAPTWQLIDRYGGCLSIKEYRKTLKKLKIEDRHTNYTMIPVPKMFVVKVCKD